MKKAIKLSVLMLILVPTLYFSANDSSLKQEDFSFLFIKEENKQYMLPVNLSEDVDVKLQSDNNKEKIYEIKKGNEFKRYSMPFSKLYIYKQSKN